MRLNELLTDRPLAIDLGGGTLNLTFSPRAVRVRREDLTLDTPEAVEAQFLELVTSWDLLQDDGTPWPLAPGMIYDHTLADGTTQQGLPVELFKGIMDRIGGEVQSPLAPTSTSSSSS